jgi:hypothetical protein
MDTKTGGAAFPDPGRAQSAKQREQLSETGMTLRDYFAAKAMHAAAVYPVAAEGFTFAERATWAYQQADAMLVARSAP